MSKLLDRRWALSCPDAKIHQIIILNRKGGRSNKDVSFQNITQPCLGKGMIEKNQFFPSFYVVRDDLLHPLVNGNKARKLDALLPLLEDNAITDVVSLYSPQFSDGCKKFGLDLFGSMTIKFIVKFEVLMQFCFEALIPVTIDTFNNSCCPIFIMWKNEHTPVKIMCNA